MKTKHERKVYAEDQPYFGVDTKEIHLLRTIAKALKDWREEGDGVSLETVFEALDAHERHCKKGRRIN